MPPIDLVIPVETSDNVPTPYLEYGELIPLCAFAEMGNRMNTDIARMANRISETFLIVFYNPGQTAKYKVRNRKSKAFGFYIKVFGIPSG